MSECDLETSTMSRPRPTTAIELREKKTQNERHVCDKLKSLNLRLTIILMAQLLR